MKDYISPSLALFVADYVNDLTMRGKPVDDKAIMGAYIAYLSMQHQTIMMEIQNAG